jgi:hypothetical protein
VWSYPLLGENEASWAVKESAALNGDLGTARENPALGVAIVTTELALAAFGEAAQSRIDLCVSWGVAHAEKQAPYQMLDTKARDWMHYEKVEPKVDFRHTLAFAVVLARACRRHDYLIAHLRLALSRQSETDGSWPSDSVKTISPVFTGFYGIELLHLAELDQEIPSELRKQIPARRTKAIKWLIEHREADGLWSSSVFKDFAWDNAFTAAWVLHRLASTWDVSVEGWEQCLDNATFAMTQKALEQQTWNGSSESQRYRVEARIAAAATRMLRMPRLSARSREASELYLGAWLVRTRVWLDRLPAEQIDVATAAFLVFAMVPEENLTTLGSKILKQHNPKD